MISVTAEKATNDHVPESLPWRVFIRIHGVQLVAVEGFASRHEADKKGRALRSKLMRGDKL